MIFFTKEASFVKLIIAIVQDEDSSRLLSDLMQHGIGVTKLATTGGFLKSGNTTLMIGVSDDKVEETISLIERICKSRKRLTTTSASVGTISGSGYTSFPVEVTVGGATLFVLTVDEFRKL